MSTNELSPDQLDATIAAMAAVLVTEKDKDYSLIKDEKGEINGFWLKDPNFWLFDSDERDKKKRLTRLRTLVVKHGLSEDVFNKIIDRKYRIISNTDNNSGGIYLMFGGALAPGEKKAWWKIW